MTETGLKPEIGTEESLANEETGARLAKAGARLAIFLKASMAGESRQVVALYLCKGMGLSVAIVLVDPNSSRLRAITGEKRFRGPRDKFCAEFPFPPDIISYTESIFYMIIPNASFVAETR